MPKRVSRIFEPFFTTKPAGKGTVLDSLQLTALSSGAPVSSLRRANRGKVLRFTSICPKWKRFPKRFRHGRVPGKLRFPRPYCWLKTKLRSANSFATACKTSDSGRRMSGYTGDKLDSISGQDQEVTLLQKPFPISQLTSKIRQLLDAHAVTVPTEVPSRCLLVLLF